MGVIFSRCRQTRLFSKRSTLLIIAAALVLLLRHRKFVKSWFFIRFVKFIVGIPPKEFKETPPAPDFESLASWYAYPGKISNAELVPKGVTKVPNEARPVDCFYVHPTGYWGPKWNQSVPNVQADEQAELWMLSTQASAFNATCRIFAPNYRQVTLSGLMVNADSARQSMGIAYSDVVRAFQHFLRVIGSDKPFVLVSHSQGGFHLVRLLEEHIDNKPDMCKRMIVCYMVGSRIPLDKFTRSFQRLREGISPTDHSGVVVGWDTTSESHRLLHALFPDWVGTWYSTGWEAENFLKPGYPVLGTNPLTWERTGTGERVDGKKWLGAITLETTRPEGIKLREFLSPTPNKVKTTGIKRHDPLPKDLFWVESLPDRIIIPEISSKQFGLLGCATFSGWYHVVDFQLFWYNIRENVKERVGAYMQDFERSRARL